MPEPSPREWPLLVTLPATTMMPAGADPARAFDRPPVPWKANAALAGTGVIILLMLSLVGYTQWEMRQEAWLRAEQTSQNVLRTVAAHIDTQAQVIGFALDVTANGIAAMDARNSPPEAAHDLVSDIARKAGLVGVVLVLDADGSVRVDSAQHPARAANLAAHDYFSVHRGNPASDDYLSQPVFFEHDKGEPSFVLSRRLTSPDGAFRGVIVLGIPLRFVADILRSVELGPDGNIMLISSKGIIYSESKGARWGGTGTDLSSTALFQILTSTPEGMFVDKNQRPPSLVSFSRVGGTEMILAATMSVESILIDWWRRMAIIGVLSLVVCAALAVFAVLLHRELLRRVAAEARLGQLSITDGLTGLANRRHFDERLRLEWRRAARTGAPLALLFIDADHFKALNDEFGHAKGDEVLKSVAGCIAISIRRPGDLAARFGGEEFAVILPDTGSDAALGLAQTIRARIEDLRFAGVTRPVTVSIGIKAMRPAPDIAVATLLEAADKALYQAKAAGRNRVILAD